MKRRRFVAALGVGLASLPRIAAKAGQMPKLVVLHTNDTHSRIDPFPEDGGRLAGLGGVARRKALFDQTREREEHVLTLDSGDIFQGTPYFNLYGGQVEIESMNRMDYDVSTVGNHEFDNGIEGLEKTMPQARFEWVSSNLDWAGARALAPLVKPWLIKEIGPFRVGIFGLLCQLDGLVNPANHVGVRHLDPVESARRAVDALKRQDCNVIICLSHLGFETRGIDDQLRDDRLPEQVEGVDLVLGGHSHTFLDELVELPRKGGGVTRVTQQGWAGARVGRLDVELRAGGGIAARQSAIAMGRGAIAG